MTAIRKKQSIKYKNKIKTRNRIKTRFKTILYKNCNANITKLNHGDKILGEGFDIH